MTRDDFLVASREAELLKRQQFKNIEISVHNGVAKVLNEAFGGDDHSDSKR